MEEVELIDVGVIPADCYLEPGQKKPNCSIQLFKEDIKEVLEAKICLIREDGIIRHIFN
jgi:hypothetical protein